MKMRMILATIFSGCILFVAHNGQAKSQAPNPASTPSAKNEAEGKWTGAKTSDGQPDVGGIWAGDGDPETEGAIFDLEEGASPEEIKLTGRDPKKWLRPTVIIDPPDHKIPYYPWAREVAAENKKNRLHPRKLAHLDSFARCRQMGVPRQSLGGTLGIVQTPGYVYFIYQHRGYRMIPLDGRPHPGPTIHLFMGDSVGYWEGNTLVIDVTNTSEHSWYDGYGDFHSGELHVTERYTFEKGKMEYRAVNYDPSILTRPFTIRKRFIPSPWEEPWEEACFEGERNEEMQLIHEDEPEKAKP